MQIGMIGLGRMGANMVRRLMRGGHECVVYDRSVDAVQALVKEGAEGAMSLDELVGCLEPPRAVWMMLPAAVVDRVIEQLAGRVQVGDILIDGGNSYFVDDIRRGRWLAEQGLRYVDVGVSGGVAGLDRGYSQMIGGPDDAFQHLEPIFRTLAPGIEAAPRTAGREGEPSAAEYGYIHCGPFGAGHFVKMVHNGIEYGLMAAYAEGLNILKHADAGREDRPINAETTPLRDPELYQYDLNVADIAEVWRRGSVIGSWLLDLTAAQLLRDPEMEKFSDQVSDSGEGRWTSIAAIEVGAPAMVLTTALYQRFESRGARDYADRVLSAMRYAFGGHL